MRVKAIWIRVTIFCVDPNNIVPYRLLKVSSRHRTARAALRQLRAFRPKINRSNKGSGLKFSWFVDDFNGNTLQSNYLSKFMNESDDRSECSALRDLQLFLQDRH
jgi:hypothetical protein